jgi:hypothetical protein
MLTERRSEPRQTAEGRVWLSGGWPLDSEFSGSLLDVSAHGFRVRHARRDLSTGEEIIFRYPGRAGVAKVIWSRILSQHMESGFLIQKVTEWSQLPSDTLAS